ncbi:MAG: response regulator [Candidatus Saccharimonas sp.]
MRIAIFEDNQLFVTLMKTVLEKKGYEVVLCCYSLSDALYRLQTHDAGRLHRGLEIDIAIVDGNLGWVVNGEDGQEICRLLHQVVPRPYIIGNSGAGAVRGADAQAEKDIGRLMTIITDHVTPSQ